MALDPDWEPPRRPHPRRRRILGIVAVALLAALVAAAVLVDAFGPDKGRIRRVEAGTTVQLGPYRVTPQRAVWTRRDSSVALEVVATCQLVADPRTKQAMTQVYNEIQVSWPPYTTILASAGIQLDTVDGVRLARRGELALGLDPVPCGLQFRVDKLADPLPNRVLVNFQQLEFGESAGVLGSERWQPDGNAVAVAVPAVVRQS